MSDPLENMDRILAMVRSIPKRLAIFETVDGHEPKSAPETKGLHCFSWAGPVKTAASASSIASAAVVAYFNVRMQINALNPQGGMNNMDKLLLRATGKLFNAYIGHFRLTDHNDNKLVRMVDIMGAYGPGLNMQPGYLNADGTIFRVGVITLPLVLNDEYDEVE